MNKNRRIYYVGGLLALAMSWAPCAFALDACQNSCVEQHYGKITSELQSLPPAGMDRSTYRDQVLLDLKRLNECLSACQGTGLSTGTTAGEKTSTADGSTASGTATKDGNAL